jgi:hypothetical protein
MDTPLPTRELLTLVGYDCECPVAAFTAPMFGHVRRLHSHVPAVGAVAISLGTDPQPSGTGSPATGII